MKCAACEHAHAHHPPPGDAGNLGGMLGGGPPLVTPYVAEAPVGGINISTNDLLRSVMEVNADYLLTSFDADHLLQPFRQRAGNASATSGNRPAGHFWDTDLLGSSAGRFLMGAGNTLRWLHNPALRAMVDEVVDGVEACKNESGYILAYEPAGFMHSEQGDYGRSWFTQGLIEVGKAGNAKVRRPGLEHPLSACLRFPLSMLTGRARERQGLPAPSRDVRLVRRPFQEPVPAVPLRRHQQRRARPDRLDPHVPRDAGWRVG
eukprot:SAG11_NODE_3055_length_2725_cov_1.795126_3_plen_262_part_00